MYFNEEYLEKMIFESLHSPHWRDELIERGLDIHTTKPSIIKRQLNIPGHGVADIVTVDRVPSQKSIITVYELKKDGVNYNTLFQAFRYASGIWRWLDNHNKLHYYSIQIILIGSKLIEGEWLHMFNVPISWPIKIYTYNFHLDGMLFSDARPYLYNY